MRIGKNCKSYSIGPITINFGVVSFGINPSIGAKFRTDRFSTVEANRAGKNESNPSTNYSTNPNLNRNTK